jgi:hypothetical protein
MDVPLTVAVPSLSDKVKLVRKALHACETAGGWRAKEGIWNLNTHNHNYWLTRVTSSHTQSHSAEGGIQKSKNNQRTKYLTESHFDPCHNVVPQRDNNSETSRIQYTWSRGTNSLILHIAPA